MHAWYVPMVFPQASPIPHVGARMGVAKRNNYFGELREHQKRPDAAADVVVRLTVNRMLKLSCRTQAPILI
jgi:hypothetical protein